MSPQRNMLEHTCTHQTHKSSNDESNSSVLKEDQVFPGSSVRCVREVGNSKPLKTQRRPRISQNKQDHAQCTAYDRCIALIVLLLGVLRPIEAGAARPVLVIKIS
jgi:hypothetical protein